MKKSLFILGFFLFLASNSNSFAQFDLETMLSDVADKTENAQDSQNLPIAEENQKPAAEISVQIDAEKIQDIPDTKEIQTQSENSLNVPQANDSEDFLIQYFNDVDKAAAQNQAARDAQNAAAKLIEAEPTMIALPEEELKKLKLSEQLRKQREQMRLQKQKEAADISTDNEENEAPDKEVEDNTDENIGKPQIDAENQPKNTASSTAEKTDNTDDTPQKAPFGLTWGLSQAETAELGFELEPTTIEGFKNAYIVKNPQQQHTQFAQVVAVFGEFDHLNAIYAEGIAAKDTSQAANVLSLYDRYYNALKKKYGNDKEYFKPNTTEKEITLPPALQQTNKTNAKDKKPAAKTVKVTNPRGNDNFLQELQEGKATLFATFGNEHINATLSVDVDENSQSRIILEYENLQVRQKDSEAALNELMNDL